MLHLLPVADAPESPPPYAEAVARLAGLRHALRLVDPFGGGPASDPIEGAITGAAWQAASPAQRRCFDQQSERVITATAAGLEALLAEGPAVNPAASSKLAGEIRQGLEEISTLLLAGTGSADPYPVAL
jgi:hypothetical protein